jgi:DNA-dependent RNA polymerase auxiliary subunit epsilon
MNVTKDYKVVSFSREQCFAVTRALRVRQDQLRSLYIEAEGNVQARSYLQEQIDAAQDAFDVLMVAVFAGGHREAA